MSIKINRFEVKQITNTPITVKLENRTGMYIKDHSNDEIISYVKLTNDASTNMALAEKIVEAIEDFIGAENEQD